MLIILLPVEFMRVDIRVARKSGNSVNYVLLNVWNSPVRLEITVHCFPG